MSYSNYEVAFIRNGVSLQGTELLSHHGIACDFSVDSMHDSVVMLDYIMFSCVDKRFRLSYRACDSISYQFVYCGASIDANHQRKVYCEPFCYRISVIVSHIVN